MLIFPSGSDRLGVNLRLVLSRGKFLHSVRHECFDSNHCVRNMTYLVPE